MGKVFKFGGVPRWLNFEPSKECLKLLRAGWNREPFGPEGQKRMAENYARWLAEKRGIKIAEFARGEIGWGFAGEFPNNKKRIRAVRFQNVNFVRGRWGEEARNEGEPIVIEIPNWNWEPSCVEIGAEVEPMKMAA